MHSVCAVIPHLGLYLKKIHLNKDLIYKNIHLIIKTKRFKQTKCPTKRLRKVKLQYNHKTDYFATSRKGCYKEFLRHRKC